MGKTQRIGHSSLGINDDVRAPSTFVINRLIGEDFVCAIIDARLPGIRVKKETRNRVMLSYYYDAQFITK